MNALVQPPPDMHYQSAVPWLWEYAGRLMVSNEITSLHRREMDWPVDSARPMMGAVSGAAFAATGHSTPERHIETVHTPSAAVLPTIETDFAAVSRTTTTSGVARLAALWDRIIGLWRDAGHEEHDAPVTARQILEDADRLLTELPKDIEFPQATVSSEGEIIFTWFRESDRLDAILGSDRHLTWVLRIGNRIEGGADVVLDETGARDRFYDSVSQFYK